MTPEEISPETTRASRPSTRREFLQNAAGLAAGAAVLGQLPEQAVAAESAPVTKLPTIKLGPHEVTRLILGGNPVYGYSHFNHLLSRYQTDWHTPERVVELVRHAEASGINTWQNSYAERTLSDLESYRKSGGQMNWLCMGKPDWD